MVSDSLGHKIRAARASAVLDVPKARLCADVIFAELREGGVDTVAKAIADLKNGCGNNWSPMLALQFMSGRRGEFAAQAAPPNEQARLFSAHLLAKDFCERRALGKVPAVDF